jgi:predicted transposase YbfD/YdcC
MMKKEKSIEIINDYEELSLIDMKFLKGGTSSQAEGCTKCKGGSNNCNVHDKLKSELSVF